MKVDGKACSINVLSHWFDSHKLAIELTCDNLELLLEEPDVKAESPSKTSPTADRYIKFDNHRNIVFAGFALQKFNTK